MNIGTTSRGVEKSEHQRALNFDKVVDSDKIDEGSQPFKGHRH